MTPLLADVSLIKAVGSTLKLNKNRISHQFCHRAGQFCEREQSSIVFTDGGILHFVEKRKEKTLQPLKGSCCRIQRV